MMPIVLKRVLKSGWEKFLRDRSSTGAAFVVVSLALVVVSFLYVLHGMSSFVVVGLQDSVDVSAYFEESVSEEDIFLVRQSLQDQQEVKDVAYISREQAFEMFAEEHREDEALLEPLRAVGKNPFLASLNIRATQPGDFESIAAFLANDGFAGVIQSVDFHDRAPVIERISVLSTAIKAGVFAVIVALSLIAILVAFNTIRLTIYNSREEIEVMRLVGASNWFIRGPFLVQGILVGIASSLTASVVVFAASLAMGDRIESFTGFQISAFLGANLFVLLFLQVSVGVSLGVASSAIAIRRYLKV
jgi:cell division transport system permease protein